MDIEVMQNEKKNKYSYIDLIAIIILFLYPLRHVNQGVDLMDAGYSLGNYRFMDTMNETWKIATYLSNALGAFFMKLPGGNTWVGMNVYTGLLLSFMAIASYFVTLHIFETNTIKKLLILIAELVALSLCWAPTTILYHYLGYYFITITAILLYFAIVKDKITYFIISGVLLGLSVIARMPNVTYAALILPVWYGVGLQNKEKAFQKIGRTTLYCLLGYAIGFVPMIGYISARYGIMSYPDMIRGLFAMTDTATDYKPTSMLTAIFDEYIEYSVWLLLFAAYLFAGYFFYKINKNTGAYYKVKNIMLKIQKPSKILYVSGGVVMIRFCYGRGMFGFDYQRSFSFYKWATVYLLLVIIVCIYYLASKKRANEYKIWAALLLTLIFITPLGSNNGLYPIINNLFIIAPVSVYLIWNIIEPKWHNFAVKYMVLLMTICFGVQSILFGIHFHFHDYMEETSVILNIENTVSTKNLHTSVDKSTSLAELGGYLDQNGLKNRQVLLYNNIPAIAYIFDMQPAIYTTWIDLDSNPKSRLEADLQRIDPAQTVVICSTAEVPEDKLSTACKEKYAFIQAWMEENAYECTFENAGYRVYCPAE